MSNLLDRFNKHAVGSRGRISDYTARVSPVGDFYRIVDIETIISSWNNVLLTPTRTYDHDPEYGSNLYKYVFEPADLTTSKDIEDEIRTVLQRYDDRASISSIEVKFLANRKGFVVNVIADYQGDIGQLSVIIDETSYFDFMRIS